MNKQIYFAMTGEVIAGEKKSILKTNAIGSCIAIIAYDKVKRIGAMAHIMLPGKAPEGKQSDKYTVNAIQSLFEKMSSLGAEEKNIEFCLAGGANVLKKKDDKIGEENINSVQNYLQNYNYKIKAKSLGGFERRSVSLNVETGKVFFSIGDEPEKLFWDFQNDIDKQHSNKKK